MWAINNLTDFAAERAWVRDAEGGEVWLVAVKGTYLIHPDGTTSLAEEQQEVYLAPRFLAAPGSSSLLYESDLIHTKPATDIILHANAYAPAGQAVVSVDVAVRVGSMQKSLRVFGERVWVGSRFDPKLSEPQPFTKMPIVYERAFGGAGVMTGETQNRREERNPVGTGFAVAPEHLLNQRAPNVEHPNALISSWNRRPQPAGFGPIARDWQPRLAFAGTYGETWERERMPLLPQDFDERFYLCAPADQQAQGYLHGGEPVELLNLTPGGALRFNLPRVALNFRTAFDTEAVNHRGILHTVIIEPEFPRVIMVWHTMLACHQKVLKLEATTITQKEAPVLARAGTLPAV